MPLLQLLYFSRLRQGPEAGLDGLDLDRWQARNLSNDIATIITLRGPMIVQLLEGHDPAMNSLFEAIKQDDRHDVVTVLKRSWVSKPSLHAPGLRVADLDQDVDMFADAFERMTRNQSGVLNGLIGTLGRLHSDAPDYTP